MARALSLAYGIACYAVFFVTFLYAAGFIGGFLTPTRLDGPATGGVWAALAINTGLLVLFACQHSVMARPAFKRVWTRVVPVHLERSTYTLFSSLALIAMFILWRPMGGTIWKIESVAGQAVMYTVFAAGFALVLITTFLINHFDLFGLRQVWLYFRGIEYTHIGFRTPGIYKRVRHPLYTGWLMAFWATPHMTIAHLVFALGTTAYILIAIRFEERDLMDALPEYAAYRDRVPGLVPRPGRRAEPAETQRAAAMV